MAKLFINYRRDDSQYQADKLHDLMKRWVDNPQQDIFIDVDNIPAGLDFVAYLDGKVKQCDALIVMIGSDWLTMKDPRTGGRRIDNPDDFVRIEIESALKRDIPVVPVLLDGVSMPSAADLPDSLKPLARRNGVTISRLSFENDVNRLMRSLPIELRQQEDDKNQDKRTGWLIPALLGLLLIAGGASIWMFDPFEWRTNGTNPVSVAETAASEAITPGDSVPPEIDVATIVTTTPSPRYTPGSTFRDRLSGGGEGPEMVVVPSGSFRMGSPSNETGRGDDEGPQRTVTISKPFAVGKFEVTWAEWEACVDDGGCSDNSNKKYSSSTDQKYAGDAGYGRGTRPVINVDWNDAKAYVRWLSRKTGDSYRLLSEAEWEYVARAGTNTAYWWGNQASHDYANYGKDQCCEGLATGRDRWENTAPVGSFSANAIGLHDLHGNVWEWTEDCWNSSYSGAPSDGSAWLSGACDLRVLRGGSWDINPNRLRSAYRGGYYTSDRLVNLGFRIARTL